MDEAWEICDMVENLSGISAHQGLLYDGEMWWLNMISTKIPEKLVGRASVKTGSVLQEV